MTHTAVPQLITPTQEPTRTPEQAPVPPPETVRSRTWVYAGVGAALASIVSIVGSTMSGAVYDPELAGDALGITERLAEQTVPILVFHTSAAMAALLLVVFAAGLRRFLWERTPVDHLAPQVASAGLLLTSVVLLMGTALNTEFIFGIQDPALLVPETAVFFGHWIGTVPWFWAGAGLTALAVGVAGRRYGAVAGWLTWVSLVLGAITTVIAVSPMQYMAGMTGPLWLLIASVALLREH